ncbi:hypothetical protein IW138_003111 [Coemansia sp. RSA 986]|nr:hypothetical protein IW138_003111 [Coemansia sp. RSA 986]
MPRERNRNESISGAPPSRCYSHAEFDTQFSRRSPVSSLVSPTTRAQRIENMQTCYSLNVATLGTVGDTYAQSAAGIGYMHAGSFAICNVSAVERQSFQAQPQQQARGNGLATEAATRHIRPVANRSADAGPGFVNASARKTRGQLARAKNASKSIRSNWYHKEEMMSNSDIKDQEFVSSDEEVFDREGRRYSGDMVAQQKLIQKQQ